MAAYFFNHVSVGDNQMFYMRATSRFAPGRVARVAAALVFSILLAAASMAHSAPVAVTLSGSAPSTQAQGKVPGQYIVVFKADAINTRGLANSLARVHGLGVEHVYQFALKGFSARMSAQAAAALSADPDVAYVEQDTYMHAIAAVTPTGVRRIEADVNLYAANPVDVDIAIIDSGVAPHPDLNIFAATDCTGRNPFKVNHLLFR